LDGYRVSLFSPKINHATHYLTLMIVPTLCGER